MINLPIGRPKVPSYDIVQSLKRVVSVFNQMISEGKYRNKPLTEARKTYFTTCSYIIKQVLYNLNRYPSSIQKVQLLNFLVPKGQSTLIQDLFEMNNIKTVADLIRADDSTIDRIQNELNELNVRIPIIVDVIRKRGSYK